MISFESKTQLTSISEDLGWDTETLQTSLKNDKRHGEANEAFYIVYYPH